MAHSTIVALVFYLLIATMKGGMYAYQICSSSKTQPSHFSALSNGKSSAAAPMPQALQSNRKRARSTCMGTHQQAPGPSHSPMTAQVCRRLRLGGFDLLARHTHVPHLGRLRQVKGYTKVILLFSSRSGCCVTVVPWKVSLFDLYIFCLWKTHCLYLLQLDRSVLALTKGAVRLLTATRREPKFSAGTRNIRTRKLEGERPLSLLSNMNARLRSCFFPCLLLLPRNGWRQPIMGNTCTTTPRSTSRSVSAGSGARCPTTLHSFTDSCREADCLSSVY